MRRVADWNDGSRKETWHRWEGNPLNVERGGPAQRPNELFESADLCRRYDGADAAGVGADRNRGCSR